VISRALIFVAAFAALQLGWQWLDGGSVHRWIIDQGVVAPAAAVGRLLTPGLGVHADGNHLRGTGGGLNIVNGCDGMETVFLLLAGFLVAPLAWRGRVIGMGLGIVVVYALNQARILALFYSHLRNAQLFDLLHGVVTPVLMVLAIAAYYYVWLRRETAQPARPAA